VVLIPSVPGVHKGADIHRYGHMKVRRVLSRESIPPELANTGLVAQCSSLGSLKQKWIDDEFTVSMCASAPSTTSSSSSGKSGNANALTMLSNGARRAASIPRMKLVWPTVDDVRNSLEGYAAGGSIPLSKKNMKDFLPAYLYRWNAHRTHRNRCMYAIRDHTT
jgi:tyrosyl-DNA phosphodiesterase-1